MSSTISFQQHVPDWWLALVAILQGGMLCCIPLIMLIIALIAISAIRSKSGRKDHEGND
ncbi:hypothetical protein [Dictyobacter vulcani]|uniref:hypothetical protein n=1 Tax=Dictyobacter vulcani TaxID=2607529 RepID=UPI0013875E33|nr:hypothetical protein [Dictyobacter vulcani]